MRASERSSRHGSGARPRSRCTLSSCAGDSRKTASAAGFHRASTVARMLARLRIRVVARRGQLPRPRGSAAPAREPRPIDVVAVAAISTLCSRRSRPSGRRRRHRHPDAAGRTDEGIQAAGGCAGRTRSRRRRPQPVRRARLRARAARGGTARRAYLLKERVDDVDQVVAAIRAVADGGSVIDPKVVEALVAARGVRELSPLTS